VFGNHVFFADLSLLDSDIVDWLYRIRKKHNSQGLVFILDKSSRDERRQSNEINEVALRLLFNEIGRCIHERL
jgi:hypothetical protein